jgi:hypothetical protein
MSLRTIGALASALAAALCGAIPAVAQPANDLCSNATPIVVGGIYAGSTVGATNDAAATCDASAPFPEDVWYVLTATETALVNFNTCASSSYDTVLSLWTGCPGAGGVEIACNDDACVLQSSFSANVVAGEDYYVRVAGWNSGVGLFTLALTATEPPEVGPDVIYLRTQSVAHFGSVDGMHGYALGSFTCNVGDANLDWGASEIGGVTPLLVMNAYRLHQGRLEQIGMSWVKNGTFALATAGCGLNCAGGGGGILGPGCRDVYSATYNGIQGILGERSDVNPFTGTYPGTTGDCSKQPDEPICRRLQIAESDLSQQAEGALYFVEGQFVAWDDAAAGNALNNASYKQVTVSGAFDLTPIDVSDNVQQPAIYAWQTFGAAPGGPAVEVVAVDVPEEGRFHVASRVSDLGNGVWRYEYAVRNFNSDRAAGSFLVPAGAVVSNAGFHDVAYHSGETFDQTDWEIATFTGGVSWTCAQTFAQNPQANALRFATMYNFWFDADQPPQPGEAVLGLFKPGVPASVSVPVPVPGKVVPPPCPADASGDGAVDVQDLIAVLVAWSTNDPAADVTDDGVVDVSDLILVLVSWGPCS